MQAVGNHPLARTELGPYFFQFLLPLGHGEPAAANVRVAVGQCVLFLEFLPQLLHEVTRQQGLGIAAQAHRDALALGCRLTLIERHHDVGNKDALGQRAPHRIKAPALACCHCEMPVAGIGFVCRPPQIMPGSGVAEEHGLREKYHPIVGKRSDHHLPQQLNVKIQVAHVATADDRNNVAGRADPTQGFKHRMSLLDGHIHYFIIGKVPGQKTLLGKSDGHIAQIAVVGRQENQAFFLAAQPLIFWHRRGRAPILLLEPGLYI